MGGQREGDWRRENNVPWYLLTGFVCLEVTFFANVKFVSIVELPSATGIMPPKPLMRREQLEGSAAGSDSFEHMARSAREHTVPLSEPRMMWGSDLPPCRISAVQFSSQGVRRA